MKEGEPKGNLTSPGNLDILQELNISVQMLKILKPETELYQWHKDKVEYLLGINVVNQEV